MKLNLLSSFCFAACLSISGLALSETSNPTENDINAEDLNRDLQRQRSDIQAASSIPPEAEDQNTLDAANTEPSAPWFKVEILLFKQQANSVNEEFPDTVDFTYPDPLILLDGFEYPEQHTTLAQNKGITITPVTDLALIHESPLSNQKQTDLTNPMPESLSRKTITESTQIAYQQEPLELLTDAQKRLEKSKNYDLVLATAWKQPTLTKEKSPTLHLVAGNWFDDQPEFEVLLKVSKQRYLHAYADVFFNTYSLKSEASLAMNLSEDVLSGGGNLDSLNTAPQDTRITNNSMSLDRSEQNTDFADQGIQPHHFKLFNLGIDDQAMMLDTQPSSSYVTNEIYHIQEDRIMKHSKDLYYLDHPKFGMIIKITPLDQLEENKDS